VTADRPPHIITPDEVDAWLADSVVRVVTYHRTTILAARWILERGVDINRSRIGAYGQGFYTMTAPPGEELGDITLTAAIRLRRPLIGSLDEIAARVDELVYQRYGTLRPITPVVAATIRRQFIRLEYDGLVIRDVDEDGVDYVVAFFGASVKVIEP
jgi:hypothetical protein